MHVADENAQDALSDKENFTTTDHGNNVEIDSVNTLNIIDSSNNNLNLNNNWVRHVENEPKITQDNKASSDWTDDSKHDNGDVSIRDDKKDAFESNGEDNDNKDHLNKGDHGNHG